MLLLVIAAATIKTPTFLFSANSWRDLLLTPSILLLLAVGQAVVIITRNVDLSVGSVLGLTAYLTGRLFVDHPGIPIVAVVLAGSARRRAARAGQRRCSSRSAGCRRSSSPSGTLYIYRGIVLTWAGSDRINASDMPARFLGSARSRCSDPGADDHRAGRARRRRLLPARRTAAAASSTRSAPTPTPRCSTACPSRRRVLAAFVLSGALAGLAGVLFAARYGTVSSGAGTGIELQAVAAVVIGGVAIFGGSGTVWGAAIGAVLLVTINRALPILGIPDFWQRAVVGVADPRRDRARPGPGGPAGPQALEARDRS